MPNPFFYFVVKSIHFRVIFRSEFLGSWQSLDNLIFNEANMFVKSASLLNDYLYLTTLDIKWSLLLSQTEDLIIQKSILMLKCSNLILKALFNTFKLVHHRHIGLSYLIYLSYLVFSLLDSVLIFFILLSQL